MKGSEQERTRVSLWHRFEFALVLALLRGLRLLGIDRASALGASLLRLFGPMSREHRTAKRNIEIAFPDKSAEEVQRVLRAMWDNFGRATFELAFLPELNVTKPDGRVDIVNRDIAERAMTGKTSPIFISAHWGSWEVVIQIARFSERPTTLIYKSVKNPLLDQWLLAERDMPTAVFALKGEPGVKMLSAAIKRRESIGLMIDQKIRQGIEVPFFGRPASTPDFAAKAAVRLNCPLVPVQVVRTQGAHYRMTIHPPLEFETTGDTDRDVENVVRLYTAFIEDRIREHPEQWFWMHNRWGPSKRAKRRRRRKAEQKRRLGKSVS